MSPARNRTRSHDHAEIRAAVLAQLDHVRRAVLTLTPVELEAPTRLGDWTVRDLAVHIALAAAATTGSAALPEPPEQEFALLDWPVRTAEFAEAFDRATREAVDALEASVGPGGTTEALGELYRRTAAELADVLDANTGDRLLATRCGGMRLDDHLVTRAVELIVHTDDLMVATGRDIPLERPTVAACARLLADTLALKAPGGSVEVRIPPYAVVQCVEDPRHTRDTPPHVVETDPVTWIRLATGRTGWGEALDASRVSTSGERADISGLLPLLS
ncbi:sterol carrier family protein [Streptomyces sp. NPDC051582]|uniref:maleylpyruvate isomerase family mycothiol-dependent enzyme n=1 Tax=Streptomyces sp. NPDC051582 TaxID=3155167 RepID=UPI00343893DB